jgi:glutathione synthase/RimK-type ligase-like ATP-grasp enzyme
MSRIAILTPAPNDPSYAGRWRAVFDRLAPSLREAGLEPAPTAWTEHERDAAGLAGFDLVLPLIAWGYHRDHGRWLAACETWRAAGVPVANPAGVLIWNSDKRYLGRLAEAGAPIVPTLYAEGVTQDHLEAAFTDFGAEALIVKPAVSGGAYRTTRLRRGEVLTDTPQGTAMIQPYLKGLETEGELSLLFFGGGFSHAIRKVPAAGDFRSQPDFGGQVTAVMPPDAAMAVAQQVLSIIGEDLLYARIDLVPGPDGAPVLIEAELIEPDFYLGFDPEGGAGFARAVRARLMV